MEAVHISWLAHFYTLSHYLGWKETVYLNDLNALRAQCDVLNRVYKLSYLVPSFEYEQLIFYAVYCISI